MRHFLLMLLCSLCCCTAIGGTECIPDLSCFPYVLDLQVIAEKIQPTITYGIMKYDNSGFLKGDQVEILEDVCQGGTYLVRKDNFSTWVFSYTLDIMPVMTSEAPPLYHEELAYYMNHTARVSTTAYYVWVDLWRQSVYIFENVDAQWHLLKVLPCATGKATTPTARGTFTILDRGPLLKSEERVKYWVKFYKNYLFHSLPLNAQDEILDARLGEPISNGCVRLLETDAKWFFETIPAGTTVWVY